MAGSNPDDDAEVVMDESAVAFLCLIMRADMMVISSQPFHRKKYLTMKAKRIHRIHRTPISTPIPGIWDVVIILLLYYLVLLVIIVPFLLFATLHFNLQYTNNNPELVALL